MKRRLSISLQILVSVLWVGSLIACSTPTPAPTTAAPTAVPPTAVAPTTPPPTPVPPTPIPAVTLAPVGHLTAKRPYVLAFANWNETNSFSVLVRKGVGAVAKRYGVTVISMDNKQDPQQANINADNAITQKVDFYFQYNQDTEINTRVGQKLIAAGIQGIAIQVPMTGFPLYRVDNVLAGSLGGRAIAEKAKADWNVEPIMLVMGYPESGALFQSRANGAMAGAKTVFPNIKIYEDTTKGDVERCRSVVADFLTAHPNEKIILWTHVDQMALSCLSAVKGANRLGDVYIAQTGGDPSIFPELRKADSIIVGTASFFPEMWGEDLVPLAIQMLNGEVTAPPVIEPKTIFITHDNINTYYPQ
ncbi:MAG TPA: sugar ABC transporter substrate-binding protein [Anaerolineae bacterium]|nr:sugar ABC transporter substrate-binding protein [Anaerolineae bacterium]